MLECLEIGLPVFIAANKSTKRGGSQRGATSIGDSLIKS